MHRVTVSIDDELMTEIDTLVRSRGYQSRSEAVRDLARSGLMQLTPGDSGATSCVAALVYVYAHDKRELAKRLAQKQHDHHDLSTATMHVHLDHANCMEIAVLQGRSDEVREFAGQVIAERGIQHGRLVVVPVDVTESTHAHGGHRHSHRHVRVRQSS